MFQEQAEISISKPAGEVYAFLAHGENNLKWRSGIKDIKLASGQAGQVGAVYAQGVAGPGGRRIAADYKITDAQPGKRLAFEAIAGPFRPQGSYELSGSGGQTTVRFQLSGELSGLKKIFMGPMVSSTMKKEVAQLPKLKEVLEAA